MLAVRKGGKLPPPVHSETYDLEYGTATLEIPADGIDLAGPQHRDHRRRAGHRRHGGRHGAAARGGGREVTGGRVVLELAALGGRATLLATGLARHQPRTSV